MEKCFKFFDTLDDSGVNDAIDYLVENIFANEIMTDSFWIAATQAFNEIKSSNICSIGFRMHNLSFPGNVKSNIIELPIKIARSSDIGAELLYAFGRFASKNNDINGVLVNNPNLSSILIMSSLLLGNLRDIGSGNLILAVNINNDGGEDFNLHDGGLYWPEVYIRKILHSSGFKRVRRLDRLEEYVTTKCENNGFIVNTTKLCLNNYSSYIKNSNFFTTALVCDKGF